MVKEWTRFDRKSLRLVSGKTADFTELAADCVAFATAFGGIIHIGIEDDADAPPAQQRIDPQLPDKIRRRIGELTVNVDAHAAIKTDPNGGEYIELTIPRSTPLPSTIDGRYLIRTTDGRKPVTGDDVLRLAGERASFSWETSISLEISADHVDRAKAAAFAQAIRNSDRVKQSIKEKTDAEILEHYALARNKRLTNLGILCVGAKADRNQLGTAPVIQVIKYDEREQKVNKLVWDDYELSPIELVDAVWRSVPDFRESYEIPEGLFRSSVPAYDEVVVRELLVNALVHRPYTQRGDIFLNLNPDQLQVVNPGLLPIGVSPQNILHTTVRRNDNLARIFHDLKLMEREGSGFDKIYEVLLSQGRPVPVLQEGPDRVEVVVRRRIISPRAIDIMTKVANTYQLRQRETICLGLLAQHEALTARELMQELELSGVDILHSWMGRLTNLGLVQTSGRTQSMRYFVAPDLMRDLELPTSTTLQRIEPHRLKELILEDLRHYPGSAIGQINQRIGSEINAKRLKRALDELIEKELVRFEGEKKARRYWICS